MIISRMAGLEMNWLTSSSLRARRSIKAFMTSGAKTSLNCRRVGVGLGLFGEGAVLFHVPADLFKKQLVFCCPSGAKATIDQFDDARKRRGVIVVALAG